MTETKRLSSVIIIAVLAVACSKPEPPQDRSDAATAEPAPPVVTDNSEDLLLSWFEDGQPKTSFAIGDIPQSLRGDVRVQDVTVPPDQRNPRYVFLADLTQPSSAGTYPVRTLERQRWESMRHTPSELTPPETPPTDRSQVNGPPTGNADAPVVMYTTNYCPVCKKARRWLLKNKIPFIEKDLQTDRAAAEELTRKGRAQGVSTSGVPIFDVLGQLVPGFDPATILGLLKARDPGGKTIRI